MDKLEKATDLYLRGFNGKYIKRRTNISIQSLLKQLKANGISYTKSDIINYQIQYIQSHYTIDDVKQAYIDMSKKHQYLYEAQKHKQIICLGCCFGDYSKVMTLLLGADVYKSLRNQCWSEKQKSTVKALYGVDNVFCKETFDSFVDKKAIEQGRIKRNQTMMERYGVLEPNQNVEIASKMQATLHNTIMDKYGTDNVMKIPDVAKSANNKRQETMRELYGASNSVQVPEIRNKIFKARINNGTVNSSFAEESLYELLIDYFGKDDILRNAIVDNRYPYHVDFYIISRDMFIELNGDKCHYTHWFDANNVADRHVVESWKQNADELEAKTHKTSRYTKYIKTWTETDVSKRMYAKNNQLNYLVFWDGSTKMQNKHKVACLTDAREWFDAGCPDSCDWHSTNTY